MSMFGRGRDFKSAARGWPRVTVDPYMWNEHAIRGWRKAGFVAVSHHDADEELSGALVVLEVGW